MYILTKRKKPIESLDWKYPLIIGFLYTSLCLLYESIFDVPGKITLLGVVIFFLPYIGCSLALFIFRSKPLYLEKERNHLNKKKRIFIDLVARNLVTILFILQIITWLYIWSTAEDTSSGQEFFAMLRNFSVGMKSLVPIWLSYPNGLCFAGFCLSFSIYRCTKKLKHLFLLALSILNIFLNDLQTSARAGMAFVIFILVATLLWDWRVNKKNPLGYFSVITAVSLFTQSPKVLREGYNIFSESKELFESIIHYSFSYLNTLSELINRLPEPNWVGERTLLPIYNIASRFNPYITRSAIHALEKSNVWGFNNYTMAGEIIRDFSYAGCIMLPFLITAIIISISNKSSRLVNISITHFFIGWMIYGVITNILMMGGFLISLIFLLSLGPIEALLIDHFAISRKGVQTK